MHKTPATIENVSAVEWLWKDTQQVNRRVYDMFQAEVLNTSYLIKHKQYIKQNKLGFGDIPFHYLWKILLDDIASTFGTVRFMEIGVYKGQVLSLIPLICERHQYNCNFLGVTPLCNAGDKFSKYPNDDYENAIKGVFEKFNLSFDIDKNIIRGYSTDPTVIAEIQQRSFNLIYVDGSHDYDDVVSDIRMADTVIEPGGYIVLDDASRFLNMPKGLFLGHIDVSRAAKDTIEHNNSYKEVFACGHNRVFRRVSL